MKVRAVAIGLKIPDNEAYTALTALVRLGVPAARVERNAIYVFHDAAPASEIAARIERNESIFNPNKHRLRVLDAHTPRAGEVWIEEIGARDADAGHYVGWRLFDGSDRPVDLATLQAAAERLLCNPAIERAHFPQNDEE
ncbi:MAG: hypothetical protein ACYDGM_07875 [Vulcanimicrobiaceae bacterium]